jgi:hypothetical protein
MEKQPNKKERKPRKPGKRSPGYPMISLEEAIQKAKRLWDQDKDNYIPSVVAYEHLGYKAKGSYGARIMSALKKFDLISEKNDDIKLTEDAVDLTLHEPSDQRYIEIIKKLALKPNIYEKIYNKYNGTLPSDATLRIELIKEHGFNPETVEDFLISFRKTIEFAGLGGAKKTEREERDKFFSKSEDRNIMSSDSGRGVDSSKLTIEIPIPLSATEWVKIQATYPLSEKSWKQMKAILDAYKPSLVSPETPEKDEKKET